MWYDARVMEIDAKRRTASVFYPDSLGEDATDGEREELNLEEAILDDEVSWPVFADEGKAREVMARREAKALSSDRRAKPAETKAARERAAALAEERKVRDKVLESVQEAMEMAAREAATEGHEEQSASPEEVAKAVETALYEKCGSVDKEYRTRARSLMFNLRDAANPQLRARVLASDLLPERIVGMSPQELANKELVEWRKARQRAAGEDAFVKGVALEDLVVKKDGKNEIHVEIKREDPRGTIKPQVEQTPSAEEVFVDNDADDDESQPMDDAWDATNEEGAVPDEDEAGASPVERDVLSFEKFAHDNHEEEEEAEEEPEPENDEEEYDPEQGHEEEEEEAEEEPEAAKEADEEEYDPEDGPEYDPSAALEDASDDEPVDAPLPEGAWEGAIDVPGMPSMHVRAIPIGGEGAPVGDILPESLYVKGRVDYKSMQSFVKQVHRSSTSRAVTLVQLSNAPSGGDASEAAMTKLIKQYRERERCGVVKTDDGVEVYIVPRCKDAEKVVATVGLTPGHVLPSKGMIGMVIHPRGIGPNSREVKRTHAQMEETDNTYYEQQFVEVPPPPPPPPPQMARGAPPPHMARGVPPPPANAPAFQAQDLQSLISNASALFGVRAPHSTLVDVPPPPPPPGSRGPRR